MGIRRRSLEDLRLLATWADEHNDKLFVEILRRYKNTFRLSDEELARQLDESVSKIVLWQKAEQLPFWIFRQPIFDWVVSQVTKKLRAKCKK